MAVLKDQFNALVEAGQYAEAIALLEQHRPPNADKAIARLRARMEASPPIDTPVPPAQSQRRYLMWFAAGVGVVVLLFAVYQIPAVRNLFVNIPERLKTACIYQGTERGYNTSLTAGDFLRGCELAASYAMRSDDNVEKIRWCLNAQGETDVSFAICLKNKSVYLDAKRELEYSVDS